MGFEVGEIRRGTTLVLSLSEVAAIKTFVTNAVLPKVKTQEGISG